MVDVKLSHGAPYSASPIDLESANVAAFEEDEVPYVREILQAYYSGASHLPRDVRRRVVDELTAADKRLHSLQHWGVVVRSCLCCSLLSFNVWTFVGGGRNRRGTGAPRWSAP